MKKIQVYNLLSNLNPISLEQLDAVKLLNRVDRKYVIPISRLTEIIDLLNRNQYSVLQIEGQRSFNYLTTYYDTKDFQFYSDHHNHRSRRIKIRIRSYLGSNLHFFEIKNKVNGRTNKVRKKLSKANTNLAEIESEKMEQLYSKKLIKSLIPALINSYTRITLVNKDKTERCTIDVNLSYQNPYELEQKIKMDDLAIIEVKQSKTSLIDGIVASLRKMQVYPFSISKYVLGLILTHPEIKHNSFKPLLLKLDKITNQKRLLFPSFNTWKPQEDLIA